MKLETRRIKGDFQEKRERFYLEVMLTDFKDTKRVHKGAILMENNYPIKIL